MRQTNTSTESVTPPISQIARKQRNSGARLPDVELTVADRRLHRLAQFAVLSPILVIIVGVLMFGYGTEFPLYLGRWQLTTPILWFVTLIFGRGWKGIFIANLFGGCTFFFLDRWIFS